MEDSNYIRFTAVIKMCQNKNGAKFERSHQAVIFSLLLQLYVDKAAALSTDPVRSQEDASKSARL